jgi:hypothetical protein
MSKSGYGTSLFSLLHGHVEAQGDIMIESFSDANWGGNKDSRSTSSAQHFASGQRAHSSSRNQHSIALAFKNQNITLWFHVPLIRSI